MQIEQSHGAPRSFVEFIRQYAMIVLSILTALILEKAVVSWQDQRDAAASAIRIDAELARNADALETSERKNEQNMADARASYRVLLSALKSHDKSNDEIAGAVAVMTRSGLSIDLPTIEHSAWDSAIADHSAAHLPAETLHHYSSLYGNLADLQTTAQLLLGGDWITAAASESIDLALAETDLRRTAILLARFLVAASQVDIAEHSVSRLLTQHRNGRPK